VYSRGDCLGRTTSVVALDGARKVSSSSGSSVPVRRVLRNNDVLRPVCVGVPNSDGAYRGVGRVLVASKLLRRASSRLRALGLDLTRLRSVFTI
jgi:hypothetical protein